MTKENITTANGKKGMNREAHPSTMQENEYGFMLNGNIEESSGSVMMLQNEPSTLLATRFKAGYKVIGVKADRLSEDTYFFLTNPETGYSEIGVVSGKCNYQDLDDKEVNCDQCNSVNELGTPLESQEQKEGCVYKTLISDECDKTRSFNFDIYHPIKDGNIVIKDEKCGKRMYWTDNYNPPRYIDLDELEKYKYIEDAVCNIPAKLKCEDCEQNDYVKCPNVDKMRIFPIYSKPCLEPDVIMVGGNLKMGTYEFLVAYCTKNGDEITPYMSVTNPISIFDKQNTTMNQTNIADQTNLGIRLNIQNLDKQYKYYKVAVIQRTDVNNNTTYFVEGIHPTTEDKIYYVREGEKRTTLEQLLQRKVVYEKTEGITESNNTLFHYGLTAHREWNLQPIANLLGAFMKWSTMKADESLYEDGVNCSLYRGNMRDEVYPYAISFFTNHGYKTAPFPLISRPAYREEKRLVVNLPKNPTAQQVRDALKGSRNADIASINENNPECAETNRLQVWQYYNTAGKGEYCQADPDEEFEFLNVDEDRKFSIKKVASFELNTPDMFNDVTKRISFKLDVSGLSARKARELGVERSTYNNFFDYFKTVLNTVYEKDDRQDLYDLYKLEGDDNDKYDLWKSFCNFVTRGEPVTNHSQFEDTFRSNEFNTLLGVDDVQAKNRFDIGVDPATQTGCNTPIYVPTEEDERRTSIEKSTNQLEIAKLDNYGRDTALSINEDELLSEGLKEVPTYKRSEDMERSYECTACRPYETDAETKEIIKGRKEHRDLEKEDVTRNLEQFLAHDVDFMYKYADWYEEGVWRDEPFCNEDCERIAAALIVGKVTSCFRKSGCSYKCDDTRKVWDNRIVRPKDVFLKRDMQQFTNVITNNCNQIVGRALELTASTSPQENTIPFFFGNFGAENEEGYFLKYRTKNGKSKNIFEHADNFDTGSVQVNSNDLYLHSLKGTFGLVRGMNNSEPFSRKGIAKGSFVFKAKFEDGVDVMFLELVPLSKGIRNNDYHTINKTLYLEETRNYVRVTIFKDSTLKKILKHGVYNIHTRAEDSEDGVFIELNRKSDNFRKNQYFYIVVESAFQRINVNVPRKLTREEQMVNGTITDDRRGELNTHRDYLGSWVASSPLTNKEICRSVVPHGCFSVVLRKQEIKEIELSFTKVYLDRTATFNFNCTHKVPLYKGCKPVDYKKGEMAYWESAFKYPDNKDLYDSSHLLIEEKDLPEAYSHKFKQFFCKKDAVKNVGGKDYFNLEEENTQFYCKPIRHFKMPDNVTAPFMSEEDLNPFQRSLIYPLGIDLDPYLIHAFLNVAEKNGLLTNEERNSIIGYEILRGDRTLEKSIVAKGLLYDTYKYTENNKEVFYPNYPYNALGIDPLHLNEERTAMIDHPYQSNKNNKFTFHSPDTHFVKPTLPREMKIEGMQYGSSKGVFATVEDHSKWVILGDKAFNKAYQLASAEVLFEKIVKAGELTVEASKNGWFVGGFSNGGGMVGAVIAAVALGLTVHQMIEQANFKRNKLQYEWEKIFLEKGEPINFASYYTSVGHYNFLNADFEGDRREIESNRGEFFMGNTLRGLSTAKYLKPGRYAVTENGANNSYRFNNFQRESTVLLSSGKSDASFVKYSEVFKTYDMLDREGNYLSSRDTAGSRGVRGTNGVSRELTSQISSMYVQLRNYVPGQYGNIDSVTWLPTGFCGSLDLKVGTNHKTCTTVFGGDTFISRFSLKRKQPMFIANAVGLAPLTPFSYTKQMNIGRARFYADYLVTSELDVGSGMMPSLRSNINFDTDRKGLSSMYVESPARFYLYYYGIPQFLVESEINCNFRYAKKEWHENFYPNVGDYIEWTQEKNVSIKKDNEYHYNQAYSKLVTPMGDKNLPAIYDKKKWDCMNNAPNGVIASQTDGSEQDLNDPYLIYKPLDFYQFPKSYGKLIDMRGVDVASVLARFENTSAIFTAVDTTQGKGQTPSNYLLGNAGMFAQKPQLLSANELGYAGTQNKAFVSSEAGYFWTDAKRGQVVMFDGKSVQDITDGLRNWFKEQLPFKMLKKRGEEDVLQLDNPFLHHGLSMGWDSRYRRMFLTKLDYVPGILVNKEIEQTLRRYERIINVQKKKTVVDETDPNTYKEVEKVDVTFEEDRTSNPIVGKKAVFSFPPKPFYFFYENEEKEIADWRSSVSDRSYETNPPYIMYDKKETDDLVKVMKDAVEGEDEVVKINVGENIVNVSSRKPSRKELVEEQKDKTNLFVFINVASTEGGNPLMTQERGTQTLRYIKLISDVIGWLVGKIKQKSSIEGFDGNVYLIGRCNPSVDIFKITENFIDENPSSVLMEETLNFDESLKNKKQTMKKTCGDGYGFFKGEVVRNYVTDEEHKTFVNKFVRNELPTRLTYKNTMIISFFESSALLGHRVNFNSAIAFDSVFAEALREMTASTFDKFHTLVPSFVVQEIDKYEKLYTTLQNTPKTKNGWEEVLKDILYYAYSQGVRKEGGDDFAFLLLMKGLVEKIRNKSDVNTFRHLLVPVYKEEVDEGVFENFTLYPALNGKRKSPHNGLRLYNSLFALEYADEKTFSTKTIEEYKRVVGIEVEGVSLKVGDENPYNFTDKELNLDGGVREYYSNKQPLSKLFRNIFSVSYDLRFNKDKEWVFSNFNEKFAKSIEKSIKGTPLFTSYVAKGLRDVFEPDSNLKRELTPIEMEQKWVECKDCPATYPKKIVTRKYKVKEPIEYELKTENVILRTERVKKVIQEYERKQDASFTLAYSPLTKTWISYYDFKPAYYINHFNYFQTGINYGKDESEFGLWSHLLTNKSYQVFYGKRYPFTIELPIKEVFANRILQNVEYWFESRRYHNDYDYAENSQVGFTKAWVYNNTNNSGQLNLYLAEKNNRYQQLQFPKFHVNSMDILTTNNDKKWTFNYFFNQVKNELNNVPIWNYDVNAIDKVINEKAISYNRRMQDRLRGDWFFVRLSQDKESRFKNIFKWLSVKETLYT